MQIFYANACRLKNFAIAGSPGVVLIANIDSGCNVKPWGPFVKEF